VPNSITLSLPPAKGVLTVIGAVIGFVALMLIGIAIGTRILAPDPVTGLTAAGGVQQVRVNGGAVYLGAVTRSGDAYIRIGAPATIRQNPTASGASPGPGLVVEALTIEPYDIAGDLVIPIDSIEWVSAVRPGSGLEAAYRQATGTTPAPSASP
jgi:hypothetical protein